MCTEASATEREHLSPLWGEGLGEGASNVEFYV